jgi:hypothetical protein
MNQYVISFDPELNIDVQQFVNAWNQHTVANKLAQAEMPDERNRDLAAGSQMVALLSGIATGMAASALHDLIKKLVTSFMIQQNFDKGEYFEVHETPPKKDGTRVFLIVPKKTKD